MKRWIVILFVASPVFAAAPGTQEVRTPDGSRVAIVPTGDVGFAQAFCDVKPGTPFYAEIEYLRKEGVIEGYWDARRKQFLFKPGQNTTRGETAAIVSHVKVILERRLDDLEKRVTELEKRAPVPGPAGPRGERGTRGTRGEQGIQGEQGLQGFPGAAGADGRPYYEPRAYMAPVVYTPPMMMGIQEVRRPNLFAEAIRGAAFVLGMRGLRPAQYFSTFTGVGGPINGGGVTNTPGAVTQTGGGATTGAITNTPTNTVSPTVNGGAGGTVSNVGNPVNTVSPTVSPTATTGTISNTQGQQQQSSQQQ